MSTKVFQDFDGYNELASEVEYSRKYGFNFSAAADAPQQFIDLLHPARLNLKVQDVFEFDRNNKTIRLASTSGYLPPFLAGQYIALLLEVDGVRTSRPYSISSPPNQSGYYDLTVRRVEGGLVSNYLLDQVKQGDRLDSTGPAGHFYYNPLYQDPNLVCLAGGSGITPFMSMIREVVECGLDRNIILFYGTRNMGEPVFHQELEDIARRHANIAYHPVLENPPDGYSGLTGFITKDLIKRIVGELGDKTFFICGPQGMYDFCLPQLDELGVPKKKVRREVYGAPMNISGQPNWPKEITGDQVFKVTVKGRKEFEARAGDTLLTSLEKAGLAVPSVCRSGECSMCRVRLTGGRVFQPPQALVRKSDRIQGYIHACVSYPITDLEIVI